MRWSGKHLNATVRQTATRPSAECHVAHSFIYLLKFIVLFSCYSSSWARGPLRFPSLKSGLGFYHLRSVWGSAGVSAIRKAVVTLCIFKLFVYKASAPFVFPFKFPSFFKIAFKFFLVKAQCQSLVQILSDLDSKGGACLGPMSGPFYSRPFLPYSILFYFIWKVAWVPSKLFHCILLIYL